MTSIQDRNEKAPAAGKAADAKLCDNTTDNMQGDRDAVSLYHNRAADRNPPPPLRPTSSHLALDGVIDSLLFTRQLSAVRTSLRPLIEAAILAHDDEAWKAAIQSLKSLIDLADERGWYVPPTDKIPPSTASGPEAGNIIRFRPRRVP